MYGDEALPISMDWFASAARNPGSKRGKSSLLSLVTISSCCLWCWRKDRRHFEAVGDIVMHCLTRHSGSDKSA